MRGMQKVNKQSDRTGNAVTASSNRSNENIGFGQFDRSSSLACAAGNGHRLCCHGCHDESIVSLVMMAEAKVEEVCVRASIRAALEN